MISRYHPPDDILVLATCHPDNIFELQREITCLSLPGVGELSRALTFSSYYV